MDFEDQSFMGVADPNFFEATSDQEFFTSQQPESASYAPLYDSNTQQNFSRPLPDQGSHPNRAQSPTRVNRVYKRDTSIVRPIVREHASSALSNLQTSLQRIRPVREQIDARYRLLENKVRQQDQTLRSLAKSITELTDIVKGFEGSVSTAYEAAQILSSFVEKMFPQDDHNNSETG